MSSAAQAFRQALKRSNELASEIDKPGFPLACFLAVQEWQRERFRSTYADFLECATDVAACRFFLEELYGGLGFRERDEDVNRVEPIMSRLLPDHALHALAEALRLQCISLELDQSMAEQARSRALKEINNRDYLQLYQACGQRTEREQQILLIRKLGHELQALTRLPLLLGLVKAVRKPAVAAGYGRLQAFLEAGLSAFRQLADPHVFVETIYQREQALMENWFAGNETEFQHVVNC